MKNGPDPLNFENWIVPLRGFTFPSVLLELSSEELELICDVHDKKRELALLTDALGPRLRDVIQTGTGAFVKLSTRSCKDWALRGERTLRIFKEEQARLTEDETGGSDDVRDVIAIVRAMSFALRVRSADEVLEMLTQSDRSYQDCVRRRLGDSSDPMLLVVREWTAMRPELELRAFVFRKRLTAMAQYYKACYSPVLVHHAADIEAAAKRLFEQMKNRLEIDAYVLDLVYVPETNECLLIELNHWSPTTSSSLFSWTTDLERLENGPFEFRYVKEPIENVRGLIAAPLREMAGWVNVVPSPYNPAVAVFDGKKKKESGRSKKSKWEKLFISEARKWELLPAAAAAVDIKGLKAVAARRPFFTEADVTFICPGRYFRRNNADEKDCTPVICLQSSLYVCLFFRIGLLEPFRDVEDALDFVPSKSEMALHLSNAALLLKQLSLIKRRA